MMAAQAKGYIAPFKAVAALERGFGYDIDADLEIEAEQAREWPSLSREKNMTGNIFCPLPENAVKQSLF